MNEDENYIKDALKGLTKPNTFNDYGFISEKGILFPRFIKNPNPYRKYKNEEYLDAKNVRDNMLKNINITDGIISYIIDDFKKHEEYIFEQEFIFPIENRELWEKLCLKYYITNKNHKMWYKSHIRFDIFILNMSIIVEYDGTGYHIENEDAVRDEYIKTLFPDSQIIRLKKWKLGEKNMYNQLKKLREDIFSKDKGNFMFDKIDYTNVILDYYKYKNGI